MRKYLILLVLLLTWPPPAGAYDAVNVIGMLTGTASSCGHGSTIPVKRCEIGSGFLCVNTPPFGTVEERVRIKGTIDVKNNRFEGIAVSVQNEYTNEFSQIKFGQPEETKDCWQSTAGYCLDKDGYFSLNVPLGQKLGPYTIAVTVTRASGSPAKETVRLSRVTSLKLTKEDVKVMPNKTGATVSVDLLHSCQFCDFIGISTGGVEVTVTNIITSNGGVKQATERTNIASGGIFSLCIPLGEGKNSISVSACNAATGEKNCPTVNLDPLSPDIGGGGITWIKRPALFYSADTDPVVELSFRLPGEEAGSCDKANVGLIFNRGGETKICPEDGGLYRLNLTPAVGINIGIIRTKEGRHPFSFGWGEMVSPFKGKDKVKSKDELAIETAGGFAIGQRFIVGASMGVLNNYFRSDEFKALITKLPQMMKETGKGETEGASDKIEEIEREIPQCAKENEAKNNIGFNLSKEPLLDLLNIPQIEFKQDEISFILNAENLKFWAKAFVDNDKNGEPDKRILPLIIAFRKIFSPVQIKVDRRSERPLYLLTGPSTDCEYKMGAACAGKPAILVPKDFIGAATKGGSFVACDTEVEHDCIGVNMINAQTGLISMTVLDAINDLLYCKGSALLTYIIRDKIKGVDVPVDILPGRRWVVPVGLDLLSNKFGVNKEGIWGNVPAVVGSEEFYSGFASELKSPDVGFIRRPIIASSPSLASANGLAGAYDFGIAIGEDLINALLFILTQQDQTGMSKGLMDWDYHDIMLKQLGFDQVKRCDEFKPTQEDSSPPPTVCNLRPRVGELLGSALTAGGYFPQKHPIMMRIRGNRRLPPRIAFFNQDGKQYLDIQTGGVDIAFYALQVDKNVQPDRHGNLQIMLGDDGNPLIQSMNPGDPNPENGPIVRFRLSAILALEVKSPAANPDDPSKSAITVRTEPSLSRLVFEPVEGGNSTVIPDESLISSLNEKINYGINIFADPKNAVKINLPKEIGFGRGEKGIDQFSVLGLEKLSFGRDGPILSVEDSQEYADILFRLVLTQTLTFGGEKRTATIPE